MRQFGLIGYPLGHSFSEKYFTTKFETEGIEDCSYRNFPISSIDILPDMLANSPSLHGFNVTIPYKQQIIPYLDSMSIEAVQIGAVNCVKIECGRLIGYNTDAYGFRNSLLKLIKNKRPNALILGSGGASKAVEYVLNDLKIEYISVSRNKSATNLTYNEIDAHIISRYQLIINTTPLGMFPNINTAAQLPYEHLTEHHFLFDLVYNPYPTLLLQKGANMGSNIIGGYDMLVDQAEKSWEIWNSAQ